MRRDLGGFDSVILATRGDPGFSFALMAVCSVHCLLVVFRGLVVLSALVATLISFIYSRNFHTIISCVILVSISVLILLSDAFDWNIFSSGGVDTSCFLEGIFLNYLFITFFSSISYSFLYNVFNAVMVSKFDAQRYQYIAAIPFFIIPVFNPLVLLLKASKHDTLKLVYPRSFYCMVNDHSGLYSTIWIFFAAFPGVIASIYLLGKIYKSRNLNAESQFKDADIARFFIAILSYMILFLIALTVPSYTSVPDPSYFESRLFNLKDAIFVNPKCIMLYPNFHSFLPFYMCFVLFMMYGLSSAARQFYTDAFERIKLLFTGKDGLGDRRPSCAPLLEHEASSEEEINSEESSIPEESMNSSED